MAKRASLSDRQPKQAGEKGRGVDALFESPPAKPERRRAVEKPTKKERAPDPRRGTARTATFNLYPSHQNFLDEFVRKGKEAFRKKNVGVGAINKSAVLQELLELFKNDGELRQKVIDSLQKREEVEGSRHDPNKNKS